MLGEVSGVAVDAEDHIWVLQRPSTLTERENSADQNPPLSECCKAAPSVIEFDLAGNVIQSWGASDSTAQWFTSEHGLFVDKNNNVWISGSNVRDDVIIKFSNDGKPLLQIGEWGISKGSNDRDHLGGPADLFVDDAANEVYVADGYRNRRIIVFYANTGVYKRHWGAYGEKPNDDILPPYDPQAEPSRSFGNPHGISISKDNFVYVCDRPNNRIQVFKKDGAFVKEAFLARKTRSTGAVWDITFSPDDEQTYLYIADGMNMKIWILNRESLEVVGSFGEGGRNAGQFGWLHNLVMDSKGNIYTVEVTPGKRIQKFRSVTQTEQH